jgi:PTS system nitrogen regulatory IIA component
MRIAKFLTPNHVIPNLRAFNKQQLLSELARRAAVPLATDGESILAALVAREQLGSTGVGHGIALPHARVSGVRDLFGMFAVLEKPIDFAAIDEQPVDLAFLLVIPANAGNEHLAALACVSRRLRSPDVVRSVRGAKNANDLYEALVLDGSPETN